jgi:hypothetical protein
VPTLVWLYLTALLYDRTSAHCVALAEALAIVSHDRLTRRLQGDWSGQRRLALACRTLVVWDRGDLLLDDTVLPQPWPRRLQARPGSCPAWREHPCTAWPWCCASGRMGPGASRWGCASGPQGAQRRTHSPWHSAAMPAIACGAALSPCPWLPGPPPQPSCSGCATMAGSSCVACRSTAGAMGTRCVISGVTLTGLRAAG